MHRMDLEHHSDEELCGQTRKPVKAKRDVQEMLDRERVEMIARHLLWDRIVLPVADFDETVANIADYIQSGFLGDHRPDWRFRKGISK